ncbi:TolC family protein [Parvularcula oceani]|uniref:TolC family protein n=1 Tax=Parvularcula oceani TaxID=1247963 RepID=UPI0004E232FB|nr:TolC family protein [Parvularcula oceani]
MPSSILVGTLAVLAGAVQDSPSAAPVLSMSDAVALAYNRDDPSVTRFEADALALRDLAIADAQLDDPSASVVAQNFPVDSFAFDQQPMTQLQLRLRQEFPSGRTRALAGERRSAEADASLALGQDARRELALEVRLAWLDLFGALEELELVREAQAAVNELIDALAASFAQGRLSSQDVMRAELELSLLADREAALEQRADRARAALARYLGVGATRPLPEDLPDLAPPPPPEALDAALTDHPNVEALNAEIDAEDTDVAIAKEAYKPSWALEGGYGVRGGDRPDLATVGVSVSIPLFTGNRQDRRLSAARKERLATALTRDELLLDLKREAVSTYADWARLTQRLERYDAVILAQAEDTVEASIGAYGGGLTDFPELIRSQLAALEAEAQRLRLAVERAEARVRLIYLLGDPS